MTWGSMLIGDDYDAETSEPDTDKAWVIRQLMQHPLFKNKTIAGPTFASPSVEGKLAPKNSALDEEEERKKKLQPLQINASEVLDGWFEDQFGLTALDLVKDLRLKRRVHKEHASDIDEAISVIRGLRKAEVRHILDGVSWSADHIDSIEAFNCNDKDLKSFRKFGESRQVSLKQACIQYENANGIINKLSQVEGDWDEQQRQLWVDANRMRKESRSMWKSILHQTDSLRKGELMALHKARDLLDCHGPMDSRTMMTHMMYNDGRSKGLPSVQKLGALLKTYGPEYNITKHQDKWELLSRDMSAIMKDPWAYTAGFLDADGYITISKRGEPRAGIIATGERGKVHCENLHKMLGCGVLQLDLKIHKNSRRSQHRLQFYSKDDITKLLEGTQPHLRLKKEQAKYVLQLLDLRGRNGDMITKRRDELYRLVKWENWKDVKADEMLEEWKVDEQEVLSWGRSDPEVIRLVDDMSGLIGEV